MTGTDFTVTGLIFALMGLIIAAMGLMNLPISPAFSPYHHCLNRTMGLMGLQEIAQGGLYYLGKRTGEQGGQGGQREHTRPLRYEIYQSHQSHLSSKPTQGRGNDGTDAKNHQSHRPIISPISPIAGPKAAVSFLVALRERGFTLWTDGYEVMHDIPTEEVAEFAPGLRKHRIVLLAALRATTEPACATALQTLLAWADDDSQKVVARPVAKAGQQIGIRYGEREYPWQYAERIRTIAAACTLVVAQQLDGTAGDVLPHEITAGDGRGVEGMDTEQVTDEEILRVLAEAVEPLSEYEVCVAVLANRLVHEGRLERVDDGAGLPIRYRVSQPVKGHTP